jgi:glycosyltransferase involved in cell wall biosynthesis
LTPRRERRWGIPDQTRHDEEGLRVEPGDPKAFAGTLGELLRGPTYAKWLGEAVRRHTENEFSHKEMVRRIESVYRATLDRTPAPDVGAEEPEVRTTP